MGCNWIASLPSAGGEGGNRQNQVYLHTNELGYNSSLYVPEHTQSPEVHMTCDARHGGRNHRTHV